MKTKNRWLLVSGLIALFVILVAWGPKLWRALSKLFKESDNGNQRNV